jgi:hypothetical protein
MGPCGAAVKRGAPFAAVQFRFKMAFVQRAPKLGRDGCSPAAWVVYLNVTESSYLQFLPSNAAHETVTLSASAVR